MNVSGVWNVDGVESEFSGNVNAMTFAIAPHTVIVLAVGIGSILCGLLNYSKKRTVNQMNNQEKIAEIEHDTEFCELWFGVTIEGDPIGEDEIETVLDMTKHVRFLLSELELKESEYQATLDKCNNGTQLALEYQEENHRLREELQSALEEADIWKHRHEQVEEEVGKYMDREQKLIEGLQQIREICKDGQAYRIEARVYKVANDLINEMGVTK